VIGAMTRLGDRLLERLVPKTVAAACAGAGAQAQWEERCACRVYVPGVCYWKYRMCSNCGGTTHCTDCFIEGEGCC
jgi:hypothetical protein